MNREQEYNNLMLELKETPEEMRQVSEKTKIRAKKRNILRCTVMPPSIFLAALLIITIAVNISPTVAYAFEQIPVLGQITRAVRLNPSLTEAVEHDFIQRIDLEQTIGEITMRVEYVIVDQRQLNIFYTLTSPIYPQLNSWRPHVLCVEEKTQLPVSLFFGSLTFEEGAIRQAVVDFFDEKMPSRLVFELEVVPIDALQDSISAPAPVSPQTEVEHIEPENTTTFSFILEFDPNFTEQGEVIYINQEFVVDSQRFTMTTAEIYPTHMRVNFSADPDNTAWLRSLRFHAENERGNRFDTISNGITAFGDADTPMMPTHILHSPFFAQSNELTIFISEVEWLDKDNERTKIDLINGTADRLPEGVTLYEARREGQSWHLSFAVEEREENHNHQIFGWDYFNEAGDEFSVTSWSTGIRFHESENDNAPNIFFVQFYLVDFPYDVVYLTPSYSRMVRLHEPIVLRIS